LRLPRLFAGALLAVCASGLATAIAAEPPPPDWTAVGNRAAQILSAYVRIDTQNPPGRTVEAADYLEPFLRQAGLAAERVSANPEKPFLIGRLRGRGNIPKPIVLLNHMDVVPADPAKWSFAPLAGELRDGILYGRGTLDMKGFAVAQLVALQLLAERNELPEHDIVFLAVPDEEVGGTEGVEWLAEHRPDLVDVAGVWDEGSFGIRDSFPRPLFFISVTEKKVLWIRLIATGRAGHGSRPFADAAPLRLHRALQRILRQDPTPRRTAVATAMFHRMGTVVGGMRGFALRHIDNFVVWPFARAAILEDPLANAIIRDTVALTMLDAGYKANVIPERAEAVLDCRLLPDTDQADFLGSLQRAMDDDGIAIEVLQPALSSSVSPTDHALFAAISSGVTEAFPHAVTGPVMSVGGTDSRFFRAHGVPAYGLIPMLLPPELIATMHGIDERVPAEALGPAVRVVYHALRQL
jgi:acetylornithine deacetylase/succinyl-diaminopimelate desuccinylase-like protein